MKATLYTVKVTKGKFKGKVVKTFDSPIYICGITPPLLACYDADAHYAIWWGNVETIKEEEVEVPNYYE